MMHLFFEWAAPLFAKKIARQHLDGIRVQGFEAAKALAASEPVIFAANHSTWWDGQLILILHWELGVEGKFLINASSFEGMTYLRHMGAIPIDRETVSGAYEGLKEAAAHLERGPGHTVMIFPQGRFRPAHLRPLGLHRGLKILQRLSGAAVVPVSITYHHVDQHVPACFVRFGEPIRGSEDVMARTEAAIVEGLDAIDAWLDDLSRPEGWDELVPSRVVPYEERLGAKIWDAGRAVLLALTWPVRWAWRQIRGGASG